MPLNLNGRGLVTCGAAVVAVEVDEAGLALKSRRIIPWVRPGIVLQRDAAAADAADVLVAVPLSCVLAILLLLAVRRLSVANFGALACVSGLLERAGT